MTADRMAGQGMAGQKTIGHKGKSILKQYRNLIMMVFIIAAVAVIAADPFGVCINRAHERAAIRNQMRIEKVQTECEIAIIQAQTEAELIRLKSGDSISVSDKAE